MGLFFIYTYTLYENAFYFDDEYRNSNEMIFIDFWL